VAELVQRFGDAAHADREERRKRDPEPEKASYRKPMKLAVTLRTIPADPRDVQARPRWVVETLGDPPLIGKLHGVGYAPQLAELSYRKAISRRLLDKRVPRDEAIWHGQHAEISVADIGRVLDASGNPVRRG
jgi:hypothetical protein